MQTLVCKHLHKSVETPIIIHQAIADVPLGSLFGGLVLPFFHDHLPLGKIADHHSPFSQSVRDEMGGFVQTVFFFVALALGYPLVYVGEVNVAPRLPPTVVALGAYLVQLFVVPAVTLEPAYVVEAPLIVHSCG